MQAPHPSTLLWLRRRACALRAQTILARQRELLAAVLMLSALAAAVWGFASASAADAISVAGRAEALFIVLSSSEPSAHPVDVRLSFRSDLQCGKLVGGSIVVGLPRAERVPAVIPLSGVRIQGVRPAAVTIERQRITVRLRRLAGVLCGVISPGTVRIRFTRSAGLGNPVREGDYSVSVRRGTVVARGMMRIRTG